MQWEKQRNGYDIAILRPGKSSERIKVGCMACIFRRVGRRVGRRGPWFVAGLTSWEEPLSRQKVQGLTKFSWSSSLMSEE